MVYKNIDEARDIFGEYDFIESPNRIQDILGDWGISETLSSVFTVHLQKGDELILYNNRISIFITSYYPLTFTGFKI